MAVSDKSTNDTAVGGEIALPTPIAMTAPGEKPTVETPVEEPQYPAGFNLIAICVGLFFAVLCSSLDRAILATAVPKISVEFQSLSDIGWYSSAYLLTNCCFQLMVGKTYAEFDSKRIFLAALVVFEIGSIVCATAHNSSTLIVGRAVAGLGSCGLITGSLVILSQIVPLHKRPKFTGAIGSALSIALMAGPTVGGVLTDKASWRWCFWINLPIGGITFLTVVFLVHIPAKKTNAGEPRTIRSVLRKFDLLGTAFLLPALISLLLALEFGGQKYPWNNWRLILLFCVFGTLFITWVVIQIRLGDFATLPTRIIRQRSIASGMAFYFFTSATAFSVLQFIPIWFQAVQNVSALQSGVNMLAVTIPMFIFAFTSGILVGKIGYYAPGMIILTTLVSTAVGLISRYDVDTTKVYWIGTMVLFGIGQGTGGQQSLMIPQTVLSGSDIALGTSAMIFAQTLGGSIFVSVNANVLQDKLTSELKARVPGVDPHVVIAAGANGLVESMSKLYSESDVQQILQSYAVALQNVFRVAIILACLSIIGSGSIEWKSVKKNKKAAQDVEPSTGTKDLNGKEQDRLKTDETLEAGHPDAIMEVQEPGENEEKGLNKEALDKK